MDRVLDTATEIPDREPDKRWVDRNGYVWLRWSGVGIAREHRVVMRAPKGTHVHHRNGVRDDNRPENLEVLTPGEHQAHHGDEWRGRYRTLQERFCVICGDPFHPKSHTSATCRSSECVAEHHRRTAKLANQKRWEGKKIMTEEERREAARASRRRWKEKQRGSLAVQ